MPAQKILAVHIASSLHTLVRCIGRASLAVSVACHAGIVLALSPHISLSVRTINAFALMD